MHILVVNIVTVNNKESISGALFVNFKHIVQRHIQRPAIHLRWSFSGKYLTAESNLTVPQKDPS